MQIAVRSYLTAGAVAVVGAGSIALAPPVPSVNFAALPAPVVADVTLTGVSLSVDQIVKILGKVGLGDVITPIINLLPANLVNNFVAEFSDQVVGLIKTAVKGVVSDLGSVITGLIIGPTSIVSTLVNAVAGVPAALVSAIKTLGTGDSAAALKALIAPLTGLGSIITGAVSDFATHVTGRIGDLVQAVPNLLINVVQAVVGNEFNSVVDLVKSAIAGITKIFGGASVPAVAAAAAVAPAAALVASPAPALAVAALPAAEVPASVAVSPRGVSRADRVAARVHAVSTTPAPAAAEAAPVETVTPAEAPAAVRVEQVAPAAETAPAASARSKTAHSRAAASRAAKASKAE